MFRLQSLTIIKPNYRNTKRRYTLQLHFRSACSDLLRAGRSGDRIPVRARFSAPVQTGPGAHPASCTMSTGSFPGVKWLGRGVDHPPSPRAECKERVELYVYCLLAYSMANFTFLPLLQVWRCFCLRFN